MAKILATVFERSVDEIIDRIRSQSRGEVHGYEIRADAIAGRLDRSSLERVRAASSKPLLLTRRSSVGSPPDRVNEELLDQGLEAGFDLIDIEWGAPVSNRWMEERLDRVVLSHHDSGMPDLPTLLEKMTSTGAAHVKIIPTPASFPEDLEVLSFLRERVVRGERHLTIFGMGERALYSRMASARSGSEYAFGSASSAPAAPGQLSLDYLIASRLHIDKETPVVFALVGSPVSHSGSPAIHNLAYDERGLQATYALIDTDDPLEVLDLIESAEPGAPVGISVTTPHKEIIYQEGNARGWELTERAVKTAAVNTVWRSEAGLRADNTDVAGFVTLLRERPAGSENCLILGAGPTARAAIVAARSLGIEPRLAARDSAGARQTSDLMHIERTDLASIPGDAEIVVDCLPAGVAGAIPREGEVGLWIESSYPATTENRNGVKKFVDGRALLEAQAEPQIERFAECVREVSGGAKE